MTSPELLQELSKLYGGDSKKRDPFGRRPASPNEIAQVIQPVKPEVTHIVRHTPSGKPGTKSGK